MCSDQFIVMSKFEQRENIKGSWWNLRENHANSYWFFKTILLRKIAVVKLFSRFRGYWHHWKTGVGDLQCLESKEWSSNWLPQEGGFSHGFIHTILSKDLKKKCVFQGCGIGSNWNSEVDSGKRTEDPTFIEIIVTGDEIWVYAYIEEKDTVIRMTHNVLSSTNEIKSWKIQNKSDTQCIFRQWRCGSPWITAC